VSDDRTKRGLRDLVLSLAVVGLFVGFLFAVVWRPAPEAVKVVDPLPMLQVAREQAEYPVLAPVGLGTDWRATSARFEQGEASSTWFLGYVNPDDEFVAVTQTDGSPEEFIQEQTVQGSPDGTREIAGQTWQQYRGEDQQSLVLSGPEGTTVVTGTVSYDELQSFVERLRT
jgi:hypothetical protein